MTLELVYHRRILEGTAEKWVAGETTWDENGERTDADWARMLDELKTANRELVEAIKRLDDEILDQTAAPVSYPFYRSLNGVLHHGIFHAGQISVLKRQLAEK